MGEEKGVAGGVGGKMDGSTHVELAFRNVVHG